MAKCPQCQHKLMPWNVRAECPNCGVNMVNYQWEERLEEDSIRAQAKCFQGEPALQTSRDYVNN